MRIPSVRYVAFRSKRNFGIELEFNQKVGLKELVKVVSATDPERPVLQSTHYQQDYDNDFWHVKFDRSCGDVRDQGGWEVASYKANGYEDVANMGRVTDALKRAGVRVNDECGFHIHAEIADFKRNHAATMTALWMRIEDTVLEILPKHRRGNKYAVPMTKKYPLTADKLYNWEYFWAVVCPQRFDHPNRRVALNLCNYAQSVPGRRTVELRLPEGTAESKDVMNWIRFFIHFVDSSKKQEFPTTLDPVGLYDTFKLAGLHGDDPFLILSKGLRDTKMWFANRILQFSSKKKLRDEASDFLNMLEETPKPEPTKPEAKLTSSSARGTGSAMWWRPSSA